MKKQFGRTCHPGGRRIEMVADHYEWIEWANDWLNLVAELETAVRLNDVATVSKMHERILIKAGCEK